MPTDPVQQLPTCPHGVVSGVYNSMPVEMRCSPCGVARLQDDERERVVLYGRGYAAGWQGEGARAVNAFLDDLESGVHREQ